MVSFLVFLIAIVPYLIWTIYTGIKRRWKKLIYQLSVPTVIYIVIFAVTATIDHFEYSNYLRNIYDTDFSFDDATFEYHSDRSFNGDGYSLSVYPLPSEIRNRFENPDSALKNEFPKKPNYRKDWDSQTWREAPYLIYQKRYFDFALQSHYSESNKEFEKYIEKARKAIESKNTFYSFFVQVHSYGVADIDLFIVDLEENLVYSINFNT